jgi:hypothetical protein
MAKVSKRRDTGRYFAELREYSDVLGDDYRARHPLVPEGGKVATKDPLVAQNLFTEIIKELEKRRRNKALGVTPNGLTATLKAYAAYHLRQKAADKEAVDRWLIQTEKHLTAAVDFFGAHTDLGAITPEDLTRWVDVLRKADNGRGSTLASIST